MTDGKVHALPIEEKEKGVRLEDLRIDQDYKEILKDQEDVLEITPKKPHRQEILQVHPNWQFVTYLLDWREISELYLVMQSIWPYIADECKKVVLFLYVTNAGRYGLWPIKLPEDGDSLDSYSKTARRAAELCMGEWRRVYTDRRIRQYKTRATELCESLPAPQWPDLSDEQLIGLAFEDRIISSLDHPILKSLGIGHDSSEE